MRLSLIQEDRNLHCQGFDSSAVVRGWEIGAPAVRGFQIRWNFCAADRAARCRISRSPIRSATCRCVTTVRRLRREIGAVGRQTRDLGEGSEALPIRARSRADSVASAVLTPCGRSP